jgi:hypothetical protein
LVLHRFLAEKADDHDDDPPARRPERARCCSGRTCGHDGARLHRLGDRQAEFHGVAAQRYAAIVASGRTISWNDMRSHLEDRPAGNPGQRARKLTR